MTVGELRHAIANLPDDMELVGECSTGQEDIYEVSVCRWERDGLYYYYAEKPKQAFRTTPVLKISIHY